MAVFRIEKTRDYTVMSNHHLRDKSLSLKAKGLLSLMLSLPEEWDYTTKGLARICKDGVDSICAGVRELEEHGYVIRQRVRNPNGQLGAIEYTILEQPRPPEPGKPERENPVLDNPEQAYPVLEEPEQGNPAQLNTNRSSKEKSKKDLSSTEGSNPVLSSPKAPRGSDGMGRDWMRERESYRELILENIEYDYLIQSHQSGTDQPPLHCGGEAGNLGNADDPVIQLQLEPGQQGGLNITHDLLGRAGLVGEDVNLTDGGAFRDKFHAEHAGKLLRQILPRGGVRRRKGGLCYECLQDIRFCQG